VQWAIYGGAKQRPLELADLWPSNDHCKDFLATSFAAATDLQKLCICRFHIRDKGTGNIWRTRLNSYSLIAGQLLEEVSCTRDVALAYTE